jgi:hypothetical protein
MVIEGENPYNTSLLLNGAALEANVSDVLVRNVTFKGNGATTRQLFQTVSSGAFTNWRFENCRFDGVGVVLTRIGSVSEAGVTQTTGTGQAGHVEFERCEFFGYTPDGTVYNKGVHHVTLDRCHFHDLGTSTSIGDNCKMAYGAEYWRILHSTFERSTRDAIDCYDAQRGLIEGNTMIDCAVHAIEIKVVSASAPNPADRVRIIGNHAVNCQTLAAAPVMQLSSSNLQVEGNLIEGGFAYGYRSGKTTDGTSNSKDISYVNNRAIGCGSHGFTATGVDRLTYLGNHSTGSVAGKGYDVGSLNSAVIGLAALNQSSGNAFADTWS